MSLVGLILPAPLLSKFLPSLSVLIELNLLDHTTAMHCPSVCNASAKGAA